MSEQHSHSILSRIYSVVVDIGVAQSRYIMTPPTSEGILLEYFNNSHPSTTITNYIPRILNLPFYFSSLIPSGVLLVVLVL